MGNPEADSSNFQKDQADYSVQVQYNVQVSYDDNSNDPAYYDPNPQSDQSYQPLQSGDNNYPNPQYQQNNAVNNQQQLQQQHQFQLPPPQQQQQHFQPPQEQRQQFQPPKQQQQFGSAQYAQSMPPQFSAAPPPQSVAQFPPQIPQMNTAYPRNGAYPPQQQPSYTPMAAAPQGWRTGLFDCMDDPMNAVITLFFPWLTFGQVAEIINNGTTTCETGGLTYVLISIFTLMPWIYSCTYRSELRSKFGLEESPAPDWIVHFLFEPCALCQEYRELDRRGWDPSIGWLDNVQKQQQMQQQPQVAMMPPMNQTMMA